MSPTEIEMERLQHKVVTLGDRIASANSNIDNLNAKKAAIELHRGRLQKRRYYYDVVAAVRSPAQSFVFWPLGAMLIGPMLAATIVFLVVSSLEDSMRLATYLAASLAIFVLFLLAVLFKYPNDSTLISMRDEISCKLESLKSKLVDIDIERSMLLNEKTQAYFERETLTKSLEYQRLKKLEKHKALLLKGWREMRGIEFENYLAAVLRELGFGVEATPTTGDQGIDLIAKQADFRIAIQVKGYSRKVSNAAVQQAVAGMPVYSCNRAAVITNSRFTRSAKTLASHNNCTLISEENFESFVMGNTRL